MPAARVCNGCGRRFKPTGTETRCGLGDCAPARDRAAESERRKPGEPWRVIYKLPEWQRARHRALVRDEHRCRGQWHGRRCGRRAELQVHHRRKLRELWSDAHGDRADFVALACNVELLVSLCPRCHSAAERLPSG
jgi:hypothetical protein